jgi:hypothetical protein
MRGINSGNPAFGGTRDTGGPFFGSFLWANKEMNTLTSWPSPPEFPDEPKKSPAGFHRRGFFATLFKNC